MNRKQTLPESQHGNRHHQYCCSFCQSTPSILLEYSNRATTTRSKDHATAHRTNRTSKNTQNLKKPPPNRPLCLLHFYTTDACRSVTTTIEPKTEQRVTTTTTATIVDPIALQQQLPPQQELFAEAFLQIQQQIQDAIQQHHQQQIQNNESDLSLAQYTDDPLALITDLNQGYHRKNSISNNSPRRHATYDRWKSTMKKVKPQQMCPDGGFLRHAPTPERIVQVQEEQLQQQMELIARMNQSGDAHNDQEGSIRHDTKTASSTSTVISDITQRRRPKRTNVWNVISADDRKQATTTIIHNKPTPQKLNDNNNQKYKNNNNESSPFYDTSISCTCGNTTTVEVLSSNTNKSQDMTKAETWGNKDRHDEVINRYLCHFCGKSWNDVE